MFIEKGSVEYITVNGKQVPVVKCEAEIVVRNTQTNQEYASDAEAQADIDNPATPTQKEHVTRSVKIKVAKMPPLSTATKE